jgi:ketosteroid isomerase-like protein
MAFHMGFAPLAFGRSPASCPGPRGSRDTRRAMSRENVEVVQRFFEAVERLLETWDTSRSLQDAMKAGDIPPEAREALGYMNAGADWNAVFSGETYRGQLEMGRGWDELLEAAENYSLKLLEVSDLEDDRVLAAFGLSLEGRTSGIHVNAALFAVVTLRDGLIARLDEYTERRHALEGVGLRE